MSKRRGWMHTEEINLLLDGEITSALLHGERQLVLRDFQLWLGAAGIVLRERTADGQKDSQSCRSCSAAHGTSGIQTRLKRK